MALFGSLERKESKGKRVVENGYPLSCLDVFKISKGEENN